MKKTIARWLLARMGLTADGLRDAAPPSLSAALMPSRRQRRRPPSDHIYLPDPHDYDANDRRQARMRGERLQPEIWQLGIGQSAWIVPWALNVAQDLTVSVDRHHSALPARRGTADVCITREEDGFVADLRHSTDYRWTPYDHSGRDTLPVVRVIDAEAGQIP
jgi:hypothetical protein